MGDMIEQGFAEAAYPFFGSCEFLCLFFLLGVGHCVAGSDSKTVKSTGTRVHAARDLVSPRNVDQKLDVATHGLVRDPCLFHAGPCVENVGPPPGTFSHSHTLLKVNEKLRSLVVLRAT